MERQRYLGGLAAMLMLSAAGCHSTGEAAQDERIGSAHLEQVIDGPGLWRHYTIEFSTSEHFADLLVMGAEDMGGYEAETEYWFVETSNLGDLGDEALRFTYVDGYGTPPSLSGDQEFTMPVYLPWTSFTSDPESGGALYNNGNVYLRVQFDSLELTQLTWYQTTSSAAANVAPDGEFSVVTSAPAVTVPSGQTGYHIDRVVD